MTTTELREQAERLSRERRITLAQGILAVFDTLDEQIRERQRLRVGPAYEEEQCLICGAAFLVAAHEDTVICEACAERREARRAGKGGI